MAEINYVEFHNFEVDCSEISGDITDISVIMQNSDVSLSDLVQSHFSYGANEGERKDLIHELQSMGGSTETNLHTIKEWIREQRDITVLTEALLTVTSTLARRAETLSQ